MSIGWQLGGGDATIATVNTVVRFVGSINPAESALSIDMNPRPTVVVYVFSVSWRVCSQSFSKL